MKRIVEWLASWRWDSNEPRDKRHNCSIPMSRAMFCIQCGDIVYIGSRCSTCGSMACMTLPSLLNRELERLVE